MLAHEMLRLPAVMEAGRFALVSSILVSIGACAPRSAPAARPIVVEESSRCPMDLRGAKVAMRELDGAIALDFTTPGDVRALRSSLRRLGDSAETSDLDGGARVTLAPVDPREYDELETRTRRAMFELSKGDCSCLGAGWLALVGPDLEIAPRR
jgi:hypothetical protein